MLNVTSNGHRRPVLYAWDLTDSEREEWADLITRSGGEESDATFLRYRGSTYTLSDFTTTAENVWGGSAELAAMGWDGYLTDSFFSGIVVRYPRDGEEIDPDYVIVGAMWVCDCSEDFGPCSSHSEEIAQRVGSGNRSADELCAVFLSEAAVALTDAGAEFPTEWADIRALVDDSESWEGSWLRADLTVPNASEGYSASDALRDAVSAAEEALGAIGLVTYWDDGYRILRITGGRLAE